MVSLSAGLSHSCSVDRGVVQRYKVKVVVTKMRSESRGYKDANRKSRLQGRQIKVMVTKIPSERRGYKKAKQNA